MKRFLTFTTDNTDENRSVDCNSEYLSVGSLECHEVYCAHEGNEVVEGIEVSFSDFREENDDNESIEVVLETEGSYEEETDADEAQSEELGMDEVKNCFAEDLCALKEVAWESNLLLPNRRIWVITPTFLPSYAEIFVASTLRAIYLSQTCVTSHVTLLVPWFEKDRDRERLFASELPFPHEMNTMSQMETWLEKISCELIGPQENRLKIKFFPATLHETLDIIIPSTSIISLIPNNEADVAIIEEPDIFFLGKQSLMLSQPSRVVSQTPKKNVQSTDINAVHVERLQEDNCREEQWAEKFNFVIGIIHNNFSDYFVHNERDPNPVSSQCHKIIKIFPTLPVHDPGKEVISYVNGMGYELQKRHNTKCKNSVDPNFSSVKKEEMAAEVFAIGKYLQKEELKTILHVQKSYQEAMKSYFRMDIYGGITDEAIQKRKKHPSSHSQELEVRNTQSKLTSKVHTSDIFSSPLSLRSQSARLLKKQDKQNDQQKSSDHAAHSTQTEGGYEMNKNPLSVLFDLPGKSINTGVAASMAVWNIASSVAHAGFTATECHVSKKDLTTSGNSPPNFDPSHSFVDSLTSSLPIKFLVSKSSGILSDNHHKVFFNPSIHHIHCKSTAEALFMNKFVLVPNTPCNEFFSTFSNCLLYDTVNECTQKLLWALDNDPEPFVAYDLTWEAATERFLQACLSFIPENKQVDRTIKEKKEYTCDDDNHIFPTQYNDDTSLTCSLTACSSLEMPNSLETSKLCSNFNFSSPREKNCNLAYKSNIFHFEEEYVGYKDDKSFEFGSLPTPRISSNSRLIYISINWKHIAVFILVFVVTFIVWGFFDVLQTDTVMKKSNFTKERKNAIDLKPIINPFPENYQNKSYFTKQRKNGTDLKPITIPFLENYQTFEETKQEVYHDFSSVSNHSFQEDENFKKSNQWVEIDQPQKSYDNFFTVPNEVCKKYSSDLKDMELNEINLEEKEDMAKKHIFEANLSEDQSEVDQSQRCYEPFFTVSNGVSEEYNLDFKDTGMDEIHLEKNEGVEWVEIDQSQKSYDNFFTVPNEVCKKYSSDLKDMELDEINLVKKEDIVKNHYFFEANLSEDQSEVDQSQRCYDPFFTVSNGVSDEYNLDFKDTGMDEIHLEQNEGVIKKHRFLETIKQDQNSCYIESEQCYTPDEVGEELLGNFPRSSSARQYIDFRSIIERHNPFLLLS